ncbi:MAG: class I SAM-dependent methyltransferase [Dissulfuribacterales bacterium]
MELRVKHEIEHGKFLAAKKAESLWGWGTPAGKERALRRARLIAQGAELSVDKKVLEIGCGSGLFTEMFAGYGAKITAIDISSDLLEIAKKRGLPSKRITFLEKRFEDTLFDAPFDAVIGSSVLHHLDMATGFHKIFQFLKPGGVMSFAEPNMLNPQVFAERKFRRWFPYVSPDETAFIPWRLGNDLKTAGFEDIRIVPFDWLHPSTPATAIKYIKKLTRLFERMYFIRNFSGSLYINARRPFRSV